MQMDSGLDTGPVYSRRTIPIGPEETAGELAERLAALASSIVREDLPRAVAGELVAERQDDERATWAPLIESKDTLVDWSASPRQVVDLVRGMAPRPGAHTTVGGKRLRVHAVRVDDEPVAGPPGSVGTGSRRQVLVRAGAGSVELVARPARRPEGRIRARPGQRARAAGRRRARAAGGLTPESCLPRRYGMASCGAARLASVSAS